MKTGYPDQYYQFFRKFNEGGYYECHDLLEEIWMEEKHNKFLQGLLQMAVGIYHFESGNVKGARLMFESAKRYLIRYLPGYWGLALEPLIPYLEDCLKILPKEDKVTIDKVKRIPFPYIQFNVDEETKIVTVKRL